MQQSEYRQQFERHNQCLAYVYSYVGNDWVGISLLCISEAPHQWYGFMRGYFHQAIPEITMMAQNRTHWRAFIDGLFSQRANGP